MRFCAAEGVPLVPFGAGSGVCGGILPDPRTVVLDLKRLERWRHARPATRPRSRSRPARSASASKRISRRRATRPGTSRRRSSARPSAAGSRRAAPASARAATARSRTWWRRSSASSAAARSCASTAASTGRTCTPLFIGSEGMLGVVTSATLRLHPAPPRARLRRLLVPHRRGGLGRRCARCSRRGSGPRSRASTIRSTRSSRAWARCARARRGPASGEARAADARAPAAWRSATVLRAPRAPQRGRRRARRRASSAARRSS